MLTKYLRNSIEAIVSIGVFGLAGFAFIDNAAHLGGLCGGFMAGWFFLKRRQSVTSEPKTNSATFFGISGLLGLGLVASIALYEMFK
jgi:hypothetical protein